MASAQATELIEASKEGDAEKVKQLLGKQGRVTRRAGRLRLYVLHIFFIFSSRTHE